MLAPKQHTPPRRRMEPPASTGAAAAAAEPAPASSDDNNDGRRTLYLAGVGEAVGTDMEVGDAQCMYMNNVHENPIDRSRQYRSDHIGTFSTEQELRRMLEAFGPLDDDHNDTNKSPSAVGGGAIQAFAGKVRTRLSLRPSYACVHI